jgi:hypothetical protein
MIGQLKRNGIRCFFLCILFSTSSFSEYIEGIDTTDANGYGLDSAFQIINGNITGQNVIFYTGLWEGLNSYFRYSFDETKTVPVNVRETKFVYQIATFDCFIVKRLKDNTYLKIQLIQSISSNKYKYKYGTNTTPDNRYFVNSNYDHSIKYKPNNFYLIYPFPYRTDTGLVWEPPLANNNHLIGYQLYRSKPFVNIDTSGPVNLDQWDSIAFTDSTYFSNRIFREMGGYLNLVAVYSEGKSDFLNGWTLYEPPMKTNNQIINRSLSANKIMLLETNFGCYFKIRSQRNVILISFTVFNISGRQIAHFSEINKDHVFWNTSQQNITEGLYIVRAELPDKSVISRTFVVTK